MLPQCDCCGQRAPLTRCWYAGAIETWACDKCRGADMQDKYFELIGPREAVVDTTRWLLDLDRREPTTLEELDKAFEIYKAQVLSNRKDANEGDTYA